MFNYNQNFGQQPFQQQGQYQTPQLNLPTSSQGVGYAALNSRAGLNSYADYYRGGKQPNSGRGRSQRQSPGQRQSSGIVAPQLPVRGRGISDQIGGTWPGGQPPTSYDSYNDDPNYQYRQSNEYDQWYQQGQRNRDSDAVWDRGFQRNLTDSRQD